MKSRASRVKSKGQVLVFVAVAMVALLGTLALCTDVAVLYHNWSQLRKEADAAALAGANYLPNNPGQATTTAQNWVGVAPNGQAGDTLIAGTPTIGSLGFNGMADSSITVQLQRTVPLYFARVLGFTSTPVRVVSTAGVAPAGGANGWIPVGLQCSGPGCYQCQAGTTGCYSCGSKITVKPSGGGQYTPGNYGLLSCLAYGNGGTGVRQGIANGCPGYLQANSGGGVSVLNKTGSTVGPTVQGIQDRISGLNCAGSVPTDPCGPLSSAQASSKCAVLMPFVNFSATNGSGMLPVYGFGLGWITGVDGQGNITFEFISGVPNASTTPNLNAPNNGPYAVYLVE